MPEYLGFSYVGFVFLMMLFVPNILWAKRKPRGYDPGHENKTLLCFERVGEAAVTCCALIFRDLNFYGWSAWCVFLIAAVVLMIFYELWWVRYFRSGRTLADFYSSFFGIPVAGATLPVLAFLFLGIYGKVIPLIVSAVILGVGHIGIHLQHRKELH